MPVQVVFGNVEHRAGCSGRSDGAQCSKELDAPRPAAAALVQHIQHRAMCAGTARRPPAISMACSIDVAVVLPLVPVTTSQLRGGP